MNRKVVFIFSGQGSQYYHMGYGLYKQDHIFQYWLNKIDDKHEDITGIKLLPYLFDRQKKKSDPLVDTRYSHPLIFAVQYALSMSLITRGLRPDYLLGSSLGEYVCFAVGGALSWVEILNIIVKQVELLDKYGESGRMLVILASSSSFFGDIYYKERCELVAINTNSNFIISCSAENIKDIRKKLEESNIVYVDLPVEYAFHSSHIDSIKKHFLEELKKYEFKKTKLKYISSLLGKRMYRFEKDYLWHVARQPIFLDKAIKDFPPHERLVFVNLGASNALGQFIKSQNIQNPWNIYNIINPYGNEIDNIKSIISEFGLSAM